MKAYLSARPTRQAEMRGYRDYLTGLGHKVTSRWIDRELTRWTPLQLNHAPHQAARDATDDTADLFQSDTLIAFVGDGIIADATVAAEVGMGFACGHRVVLIGPREITLHTHPAIEWCGSWELFVARQAEMARLAALR